MGVVFYDVRPISADLCLDACLTGLGGVNGRQCYALPLLKDFHNYTIVHLEILNVLDLQFGGPVGPVTVGWWWGKNQLTWGGHQSWSGLLP